MVDSQTCIHVTFIQTINESRNKRCDGSSSYSLLHLMHFDMISLVFRKKFLLQKWFIDNFMFFILMTHSEISFSYDYFKGIDNCNFDISPMFLNKSLHDHISDLVSDETMFTYDLYLPLHFWIETDCTAWSEISCILFLIEWIIGIRGQSRIVFMII